MRSLVPGPDSSDYLPRRINQGPALSNARKKSSRREEVNHGPVPRIKRKKEGRIKACENFRLTNLRHKFTTTAHKKTPHSLSPGPAPAPTREFTATFHLERTTLQTPYHSIYNFQRTALQITRHNLYFHTAQNLHPTRPSTPS